MEDTNEGRQYNIKINQSSKTNHCTDFNLDLNKGFAIGSSYIWNAGFDLVNTWRIEDALGIGFETLDCEDLIPAPITNERVLYLVNLCMLKTTMSFLEKEVLL